MGASAVYVCRLDLPLHAVVSDFLGMRRSFLMEMLKKTYFHILDALLGHIVPHFAIFWRWLIVEFRANVGSRKAAGKGKLNDCFT